MTDHFTAALEEIEKAIGILSREPHPDRQRIEFWTRKAVELREEIARQKKT
jgi:hypothetical protein